MTRDQKTKRTTEVRRRVVNMHGPKPSQPVAVVVTPKLIEAARLIDLGAFDSKLQEGDVGYDAIIARQKFAIDTAHTIQELFRVEA